MRPRAPQIVFGLGLAIVFVVAAARALADIKGTSIELDAWEWVKRGRTWGNFFHEELGRGDDRFRPLVHVVFVLFTRSFGLAVAPLGDAFFAVTIGLHALYVVYLRQLGFRLETAVAAAFITGLSTGVFATFHILQYNDVTLGACFTLAALTLCLREGGARLWLAGPLVVLGILSHESALATGPLLVLSHWYRDGLGRWRAWASRPTTLGLVAIALGYPILRLAQGAGGHSNLLGVAAVPGNLATLVSNLSRELLFPLRPALLLGGAWLLYRHRLDRARARRGALFGLGWVVLTYGMFLLNRLYQSNTYLNVTLLVPALLVAVPLSRLLFDTEGHLLLRTAGAALAVATVIAPPGIIRSPEPFRVGKPVLDAVASRLPQGGTQRMDAWVVELAQQDAGFGRTVIENALLSFQAGQSVAFEMSFPGRDVAFHDVSKEVFRFVQPRTDDVVLASEPVMPGYVRVWAFSPEHGGAPSQIWGRAPAGPAPALPVSAQSPPSPLEAQPHPLSPDQEAAARHLIATFWLQYRDRQLDRMESTAQEILALTGRSEGDAPSLRPAWLAAILEARGRSTLPREPSEGGG